MECSTGYPKISNNYRMDCFLNADISVEFDNIYLLPFSFPYRLYNIYQVIIKNAIKGSIVDPEQSSISCFLKLSISIFISILFLL